MVVSDRGCRVRRNPRTGHESCSVSARESPNPSSEVGKNHRKGAKSDLSVLPMRMRDNANARQCVPKRCVPSADRPDYVRV
jgi:hypothetical protein